MARTLRDVLNEANPNKVAMAEQLAKLGDTLVQGSALFYSGAVGGTTAHTITLPNGRKALKILLALARTGGVTGYFTEVAPTAALATTQVQVTPTGDILFLAADAVTAADVLYIAQDGTIYTDTVPVAANVAAFAQNRRGVVLLSVNRDTGGATGAATILKRAAAPAAGQSSLKLDGTGVTFAGADAVTKATIQYIAAPGVGTAPNGIPGRLDASVDL